jgi:hypothetical protein
MRHQSQSLPYLSQSLVNQFLRPILGGNGRSHKELCPNDPEGGSNGGNNKWWNDSNGEMAGQIGGLEDLGIGTCKTLSGWASSIS